MSDYWDAFPPGPSPQLWRSWGSGWDAIMRGWHAMRNAYVVFDVLRLLIVGGCCKPRRPRTRDPYRLMASGPSPQLMWSWGNGWDEVVIVIWVIYFHLSHLGRHSINWLSTPSFHYGRGRKNTIYTGFLGLDHVFYSYYELGQPSQRSGRS